MTLCHINYFQPVIIVGHRLEWIWLEGSGRICVNIISKNLPLSICTYIREEVINASHIGVWVLVTKHFHLKKYSSEKHEIVKFQGSYILEMVEITYF